VCEALGADVQTVAKGIGMDRRIGSKFLHAGPGYGGSCFPKDTHALSAFARAAKVKTGIVDATIAANENQMARMVDKIVDGIGAPRGKTVAVLGLSFKPNTDDLRAAPALTIIAGLQKRGVKVRAFDPVALEGARLLPSLRNVAFAEDAYDCARGAHAVAIVTEWNEFRNMDLARLKRVMKRPVLCDLRNLYDADEVEKAGLRHIGVGRGRPEAAARARRSSRSARASRNGSRPARRSASTNGTRSRGRRRAAARA
jgi:UDPglucose 6-dehydrogenase